MEQHQSDGDILLNNPIMTDMTAFQVVMTNEENNFVPEMERQNPQQQMGFFRGIETVEKRRFVSMQMIEQSGIGSYENSDVPGYGSVPNFEPTGKANDFEFIIPHGITDLKNSKEHSTIPLDMIAEDAKEAFQKRQMASATHIPNEMLSNSNNNNDINFDHGYCMPLPGNTIVQVPSPWILAIESPMETLSTFDTPTINTTDFTPSGTPLLTSPWASPSMTSPYLNPYDESMNLNAPHHIHGQYIGDISTWWSENSEVVDAKSFNELLMDTGFDLEIDVSNDTLMMNGGEAEVDIIDSTMANNDKFNSSYKRTKNCFPEESMPSGAFWKVIKSHNQQTLFQCPFEKSGEKCGKTFTRPYNLKSHYRSHTGERPHVCEYEGCSLKFSRKYDLKRHEKIHSGVKAVQCPDCGKSFIRTDYLRRHQKVPEGKRESECQVLQKKVEK